MIRSNTRDLLCRLDPLVLACCWLLHSSAQLSLPAAFKVKFEIANYSQRLRSPVWDHFQKITDKNVKCNRCEAVLSLPWWNIIDEQPSSKPSSRSMSSGSQYQSYT